MSAKDDLKDSMSGKGKSNGSNNSVATAPVILVGSAEEDIAYAKIAFEKASSYSWLSLLISLSSFLILLTDIATALALGLALIIPIIILPVISLPIFIWVSGTKHLSQPQDVGLRYVEMAIKKIRKNLKVAAAFFVAAALCFIFPFIGSAIGIIPLAIAWFCFLLISKEIHVILRKTRRFLEANKIVTIKL